MKHEIKERIAALRAEMKSNAISAVIIPQTDPHQSEYIASHWQVRRWLSGFTGSAGSLVVTASEALLWTDSRYFLQAAEQLDGTGIKLMKDGIAGTPSIAGYLCRELVKGSTVGIDGMLFSAAETERLRTALAQHDINLNNAFDVIDRLWTDRPALPLDAVFIHDIKYAGKTATDKLTAIREAIHQAGADALLVSALDEIAWTLNIRSRDVKCNPVATAFLYISSTRTVLFIDPRKLSDKISAYLAANHVETAPYESIATFLESSTDCHIIVDPNRTTGRLCTLLGERAITSSSLIALPKACRNEIQIEGTRRAMERDGAALVKAMMEIEQTLADNKPLTEIGVAEILRKHRSAMDLFIDESFDTIAGYGPHGAIVHYSATEKSDTTIGTESLLLIDSGAQYLDGTTDITRTISLGTPTPLQKSDFTLVLKGHIALARAIYPEGTRGSQLDVLAHQYLWQHGLNYLHGTGHGVGHFLNVHEGPQGIRLNDIPVALMPGMVTSDEPGLYRTGVHGIRCENLLLTVEAFSSPEAGRFFRFETLTLFPFDRSLCDLSIMTDEEVAWLDSYHAEVYARLSPLLNDSEREWLVAKTAPLA